MSDYNKDQLVRFSAVFTTGGTVEDPTTVELRVKEPSRATTIYYYPSPADLTRDSKGTFHIDILLDEAGVYKYRWVATGLVQTSGQDQVIVEKPNA